MLYKTTEVFYVYLKNQTSPAAFMKGQITSISDIAKELGVSPSTVSRALKNHPDISVETRLRVQELAAKVNYRPNALAIGLKHQRSNTIGIIIPEIVHHFFSSIISGIEELAYSEGYRVMICQSNEDYAREEVNLQALLDHRVDGLLVSISKGSPDCSHFTRVVSSHIPIVFIDRVCWELESDRVITDDYQGARVVCSHLIERGSRRIIHLGTPDDLAIGVERYRGYCQALEDYGIPIDKGLVFQRDTPRKVLDFSKQLLALAPGIDGLFAVNDSTAITAMRILQDAGYQVPGQIRIAGFGDDPVASMVNPSLTTVEQKGYEMGREAIEILLRRLQQKSDVEHVFQTKVFSATLRVRNST